MNRTILEQALSMMETNEHFTMASVYNWAKDDPRAEIYEEFPGSCGTAGCIAGHVIVAARLKGEVEKRDDEDLLRFAGRLAGITTNERRALFTPGLFRELSDHDYDFDSKDGDSRHITREHASRCLRKFIDTGIVDWAGTAEEE